MTSRGFAFFLPSWAGHAGVWAGDRIVVNPGREGFALEGHSPVPFFTEGRPVHRI